MAAAAALSGASGAFAGFGTALGQAVRGIRSNLAGIASAARSTDGVKRVADQSGREFKRFVTGAGNASRGVSAFAKAAGAAGPTFARGRSASKKCVSELRKIKNSADTAARSASVANKGAGTGAKLAGPLSKGLTGASAAVKAVNLAMKANPLGLLVSLVAPLIMQLVETAMNSKAGQKIMQQVFSYVGTAFKAIAKFVLPLVKGIGAGIAKVWNGVKSVISGVVKAISGPLTRGFNAVRTGVSTAMNAARSLISTVWGGFRKALATPLKWITEGPSKIFDKVKSTMSRTLSGIAEFVTSGLHSLLNVIKGPVNGVISFINWAIDKLNGIQVNAFGKKFGINLPKVPMLAEGGVVTPCSGGVPVILAEAGETEVVLPLAKLHHLLARTAERAGRHTAVPRLDHYEEPTGRGAHAIAEDLLFLARTGADTRR